MSKYIKKYGLFLASLLIILGFGIFQANSAVRSVGSETGSATATETKSCWQQGYRMISCPDGNCQTCTDSSNGKNYFRKGTCNTTGYINSCPAGSGQIPDPLTKLSCNSEYSLTCVCDANVYKYGEGRAPCSENAGGGGSCTIGGKTFYKTCECPAKYSKTCEEGVELPVDANDSCGGKYQACKCITQVVAVGQTCTQKVVNGTTCYVDCRAETIKTCETEGYVTSCPVGQVGTSVTANDGKLSCKKDCVSCVSVMVYNGEYCVNTCATNSSICIEKKQKSCKELLESIGCIQIPHNAILNDRYSQCIALMGTPVFNNNRPLSLAGVMVFDASEKFESCKTEMGGRKALLKLDELNVESYARFYVDVEINKIIPKYASSSDSKVYFDRNSTIGIYQDMNDATTVPNIKLIFDGWGRTTKHYVDSYCTGPLYSNKTCYVEITSDFTTVYYASKRDDKVLYSLKCVEGITQIGNGQTETHGKCIPGSWHSSF